MENINIGMIGISEGNGHPYSWSAIINGYDEGYMKSCPFPVIPEYLGKQTWPESAISNATVSKIWTQDERISKQIAKASNIKNICKNIEFPDHYFYKKKDIKKILKLSEEMDCKIITTEKDYVKLSEVHKKSINFLQINLKIYDDENLKKILTAH